MRQIVLTSLLLTAAFLVSGQRDLRLQRKITELLHGFPGETGVYVKNLRTGKQACINADTIFPTASMIKVPILIGVMTRIARKEIVYHQDMTYNDSLLYEGSDILGSFKSGEKIELSKLLMLMLSTSDNTASLWLQSLAGGGMAINRLLDSLGYRFTRVNSRTPGREAARALYGWGQTTPREMAGLFESIYKGRMIDAKSSDRMLRLLGRNHWDEEALSQLPPTVFAASKNGAVDESRSETVLVMARRNPYVFSVITKNNKDTSWTAGNKAWVLIRRLSALLWKYYSPHHSWQPAAIINDQGL